MALDLKLIQSIHALIKPLEEQLVKRFHSHLVTAHPECGPWFPEARWKKDSKLLARSLHYVVTHLEHPDPLEHFLHAVGRNHAAMGITKDQYNWAGDALMTAMQETVGARWTKQAAEEWAETYRIIVDVMVEGAATEAPKTNVVPLRGSSPSSIEELLPTEVRDKIRASVQAVVRDVIQDEIRRVVDEELAALGPEDVLKALRRTG